MLAGADPVLVGGASSTEINSILDTTASFTHAKGPILGNVGEKWPNVHNDVLG